jgi:tetratricopeptide (TPR) repeat protein
MKRLAGLVLVGALAGAPAVAQDAQRGIALYNEGKYAEAEAALKAAPTTAETKAYLAATLERLDRHAEAEAQAKAALATDPVQPVAVQALGAALVNEKKLDEAITRMSAALAAKPNLAYAYYWRGQAYQRTKQVARMVDDYRHFLKLAPDAPEAPAVKVLLGGVR